MKNVQTGLNNGTLVVDDQTQTCTPNFYSYYPPELFEKTDDTLDFISFNFVLIESQAFVAGGNYSYCIRSEKVYEYNNTGENWELIWIKAELWYAVNFEMVTNLSDFCVYRTEMVLFEPDKLKIHINFMADCLAEFLDWNTEEKEKQTALFIEHWKEYKI